MADTYTILQLELPCKLSEVSAWWEEVNRVIGNSDATVANIPHADGHDRLTVSTPGTT